LKMQKTKDIINEDNENHESDGNNLDCNDKEERKFSTDVPEPNDQELDQIIN